MAGLEVFYPIGWDDNGLPTERRVQNYYGVRGDATLHYDPDFVPPHEGSASDKAADQVLISRRNFNELCETLTVKDEVLFEDTSACSAWPTTGTSATAPSTTAPAR